MNKKSIYSFVEDNKNLNQFDLKTNEPTMLLFENKKGYFQIDYFYSDNTYSVIYKYEDNRKLVLPQRFDYLNLSDVKKIITEFSNLI